jgi:hypothetical protein
MLAARATSRLRQIIRNSDDIDLQISIAPAVQEPKARWPATGKWRAAI